MGRPLLDGPTFEGRTTTTLVDRSVISSSFNELLDEPGQVVDVRSADFRCYTSETQATAATVSVAAGSTLGFQTDGSIYHPSVTNVYLAKACVTSFSQWVVLTPYQQSFERYWLGWRWCRMVQGTLLPPMHLLADLDDQVYQLSAVTNGGSSISFPSDGLSKTSFSEGVLDISLQGNLASASRSPEACPMANTLVSPKMFEVHHNSLMRYDSPY